MRLLFVAFLLAYPSVFAEPGQQGPEASEPPPAAGPDGEIIDPAQYNKNRESIGKLATDFSRVLWSRLSEEEKSQWQELRNLLIQNGCAMRIVPPRMFEDSAPHSPAKKGEKTHKK